ncbi:MAG TPA: hypothetical protein VH016_11990 [Actinomycetota bacterium]|nr:hypothetical protein [Actinomycetota bacterium]
MDRDDAGTSDRSDEARQGDTGMIGSESEDPGPGRDTSLTDPDPVAASTDQPRATVAMSEGDPMRTRLGSQIEGAGAIGHDVVAAEEGATEETPADDRPGYEPERSAADASAPATTPTAFERDPGLAAEPVVDQQAYERDAGEPGDAPATYTGEEADVTGRPEYAERTEGGDQPLYEEETQRMDRPGGGGSLFTDEEPERLDRPGPQEPGVQDGVFDQEADRARRPSDGV